MIGKNNKVFDLDYTSEEDDEKYAGRFTTKRLSIKDRGQIGVRKSQLMGGMYCVKSNEGVPTGQGVDEDTDYLNAMIAHLDVCLIQKPAWFDLDDIADIGVVQAVYKEVMDFEMSFFRAKNRSKDSSGSGQVGQDNSSEQHQGSGSGNNPTPVVDEKVQAALDA